jgi:HTH-type transcriptional repressor of NAD biosynthesis genes
LVIDDAHLQQLCDLKRIEWRLLPRNDASDREHRDFVGWLCWTVLGVQIDAVFTSEDYGDGLARSLDEYFRAKGMVTSDVQHVSVDPARAAMPISGTKVRGNPFAYRQYVSPDVYADLIERVAILGGESSGKTTLSQALASHFQTTWVPEYGRDLWEARSGQLLEEDMPQIALRQVDNELRFGREARNVLFCDTTPLTTAFYSQEMFGRVDLVVETLAWRRYDYTFLCAPDFEFVQDGTRQTARFRALQHEWYEDQLVRNGVDFEVVSGPVHARLEAVAARLSRAK